MMNTEQKDNVRKRLRRIAGQVAGVERMVEEDRYCVDVLMQVSAIQAALGQVGKVVLGAHVDTCVADALASGDQEKRQEKVDELTEVFSRFAQIRAR